MQAATSSSGGMAGTSPVGNNAKWPKVVMPRPVNGLGSFCLVPLLPLRIELSIYLPELGTDAKWLTPWLLQEETPSFLRRSAANSCDFSARGGGLRALLNILFQAEAFFFLRNCIAFWMETANCWKDELPCGLEGKQKTIDEWFWFFFLIWGAWEEQIPSLRCKSQPREQKMMMRQVQCL